MNKLDSGFRKLTKTIILIIILIFTAKTYYKSLYFPVDKHNQTPIIFTITSGETAKDISKQLKEKELIKSEYVFYNHIKKTNLDKSLLAGKFILSKNLSVPEIAQILTGKSTSETIFTIPEGFTIKQIDAQLTAEGLIEANQLINRSKTYAKENTEFEFLKNTSNLEGFLFPDTYFINPADFEIDRFIHRLLTNFKNKTTELNLTYNDIIMASIIEKEVLFENDMEMVSGILWKRLKEGWPLQADATLLYIKEDNIITKQDLQNNSPYNTRIYKGLPPTPISNPGIKALKAALNPKKSDYWFYLNKPDTGETIYAVTNEEHNQNRDKYLN